MLSDHGISRVEYASFNLIMSSTNPRLKQRYLKDRDANLLEEEDLPIAEIREVASSCDMTPVQVHSPDYCLCQPDPELRKLAVKKTVVMLRVCRRLEASILVVHVGNIGSSPAVHPAKVRAKTIDSLLCLVDEAYDLGVRIALENGWMNIYGSRSGDLVGLIEETDPDQVAACLDTGHARRLGASPASMVRELGEHLATTHIHDYDGNRDHIAPFSGIIDWSDFSSSLSEVGYDGNLIGEIEGPSDTAEIADRIAGSRKAMGKLTDIVESESALQW